MTMLYVRMNMTLHFLFLILKNIPISPSSVSNASQLSAEQRNNHMFTDKNPMFYRLPLFLQLTNL